MIHLSIGSGKMENIVSINTSSLSNPFCKKMSENKENICSRCYSSRYEYWRKYFRNYIQNNLKILSNEKIKKEEIPDQIKSAKLIRLHSFGELINNLHYENFIRIAEWFSDITFSLWTKRDDIIKKYEKPKNLILVRSSFKINKIDEPDIDKYDHVFTVFNKSYIKRNSIYINCGGKSCISCLKCYGGDISESDFFINEKLK